MTTVVSGDFNNIAIAISAYADAARADAALYTSTALVGSDARITDSGENFTGVIRWVNYTDSATGAKPDPLTQSTTEINTFMTVGNQAATYVKNVDVVAAKENSVQSLISKVDGLSYLGRQFGAVRARREDANLRSVIAGIGSDILGTYGVPTNDQAPFVQGTFGYVTGFTLTNTVWEPLFANTNAALSDRSTFFDNLLDAMSAVQGEFEEPFYYLAVSPATFNILRKQNVLDGQVVTDGNLNINTLLGGKIRLIVSGNELGGVGTTLATAGLTVSYLMKASAIHYSNVVVNNPTAVYNQPLTNEGFGDVTILSRWGNIMHPAGYTYAGSANAFPTNAVLANNASWSAIATNVNQTGIFPIFHG